MARGRNLLVTLKTTVEQAKFDVLKFRILTIDVRLLWHIVVLRTPNFRGTTISQQFLDGKTLLFGEFRRVEVPCQVSNQPSRSLLYTNAVCSNNNICSRLRFVPLCFPVHRFDNFCYVSSTWATPALSHFHVRHGYSAFDFLLSKIKLNTN